jgi:hypothetical protein
MLGRLSLGHISRSLAAASRPRHAIRSHPLTLEDAPAFPRIADAPPDAPSPRISWRWLSRCALIAATVAIALGASPALAQTTLDRAENAYSEIDFPRVIELANEALQEGGHSPEEVARLYELIGLSHAAEREEDPAREAYVKMLALRPDAEVDTNLAPRLRGPFLEARGFWASRSSAFSVETRVVRARGAIRVELSDPLGMASEIRVLSRDHAVMGPMEEQRIPAEADVLVEVGALPDAPQMDYAVQVLDEHGNRLAEIGTEDEPRIFGDAPVVAPPPGDRDEGGSEGIPMWVWIVGGVVAAGALALGLGFGLRDDPITLRSAVTFE